MAHGRQGQRIAQKDKRIAELEALLKAALEHIAVLEKNSTNSSKPPSSKSSSSN